MAAGMVLVALGIKKTLAHVGDPLGPIPTVAMCGGVALYLLGHNAFRLRDVGSVPRLVATVAALALIPVAVRPRPWSPRGRGGDLGGTRGLRGGAVPAVRAQAARCALRPSGSRPPHATRGPSPMAPLGRIRVNTIPGFLYGSPPAPARKGAFRNAHHPNAR